MDDDQGTRETFAFALGAEQFDVVAAAAGERALEIVRTWTPDLVFCDLDLPVIPGLEVLRLLRIQGITCPFVIITGCGTVSSALQAGRLGAVEYVEKPIATDQIVQLARDHAGLRRSDAGGRHHAGEIRSAVERQYSDPQLRASDVATAVGMSTQHLCRVTKQQLGQTFTELLRGVRVRAAKRLLDNASVSIKEVAFSVGFRHPSQFTRIFRHEVGLAPSEYRQADANVSPPLKKYGVDAPS